MKDLDNSRTNSAANSKKAYDRDPGSGAKPAARSKASYHKDPESGAKSTARSKASYYEDIEKGCAKSAASSKAHYERNIAASRACNRQRYVLLCVCSQLITFVLP